MVTPRPLFLLGNKRSGTSHLVRLLNLHPAVFVAHESDVIWILYQMAHSLPFCRYPWDGPVGMEATLKACSDFLDREAVTSRPMTTIPELFYRVLFQVMQQGSNVQQPHAKGDLAWIGDKKPVQQADPEILPFIRQHFAEARFIHIVRHPQAVVSSMVAYGNTRGKPEYWKGSLDSMLERWAIHEEWVLAAKDRVPLFSLRYEDLCAAPSAQLGQVFRFLELEIPAQQVAEADIQTAREQNRKHDSFVLPCSARAERIMELYGYAPLPQRQEVGTVEEPTT